MERAAWVLGAIGLVLGSSWSAGCSSSHTGDVDGSTAGGCDGPAPTNCVVARGEGGCCERGPGRCVDGVWQCNVGGMGFFCEGPCGGESCAAPPPTCREDLGGGCCGAPVAPVCFTPSWSCPSGSVEERTCTSCGTATPCDDYTEAECIAEPTCAPLYDDLCCPSCLPIGACADCTRIAMYRCAPIDEACATGVCGQVSPEHCAGAVADCGEATPTSGYRCSVPGCVVALDAGCVDECPVECVAVTAESCEASCDVPAPACPLDMTAESAGGCYTGRCVAASACAPGPVIGP